MNRLEILNSEIKEFGLDTYILLKYGTCTFFAFGGTVEKYYEILEDYKKSYAIARGEV